MEGGTRTQSRFCTATHLLQTPFFTFPSWIEMFKTATCPQLGVPLQGCLAKTPLTFILNILNSLPRVTVHPIQHLVSIWGHNNRKIGCAWTTVTTIVSQEANQMAQDPPAFSPYSNSNQWTCYQTHSTGEETEAWAVRCWSQESNPDGYISESLRQSWIWNWGLPYSLKSFAS